jgi:hypothetical protein
LEFSTIEAAKNAKFYRGSPKYALVQNILRLGDIDLDGYPDLAFNAQYTENTTTLKKTVIFQNLECPAKVIDEMKKKFEAFDGSKCRYFTSSDLTSQLDTLTKDTSFVTTFFDWGEMG